MRFYCQKYIQKNSFAPSRLVFVSGQPTLGGQESDPGRIDPASLDLRWNQPSRLGTQYGPARLGNKGEVLNVIVTPEGMTEEQRREGEKQKRAREIQKLAEDQGEAREYAEELKKSKDLPSIVALLNEGIEENGPDSAFNYKTWTTLNPSVVVDIFNYDFFPKGVRGLTKFKEGLLAVPTDSNGNATPEYKASKDALQTIVNTLTNYKIKKDVSEAEATKEKPLFGHTLDDVKTNLVTNWKGATGQEKLFIGGAIVILAYLGYKMKDKKLIGDLSFSDAAKWIGGAYLINYLSGKVSADGKTLINRLDVDLKMDEMENGNPVKAFLIEGSADEVKTQTVQKVLHHDVKQLFELYDEASSPEKKIHEISPQLLGLKEGEISGKALYEVIEQLVKTTSMNQARIERDEEAKRRGVPPSSIPINKEYWLNENRARDVFRAKYITTGPFSRTHQDLFSAIYNEYGTKNVAAICQKWEKEKVVNKAMEATGNVLKWTYKNAKDYAIVGGAYVVDVAGKAWDFTRDDVLKPVGRWFERKYNKYSPPVKEWIREKAAKYQEDDLKKVVPDDLDLFVKEPNKARIMGVPNIPVDVRERDTDGKDVAIINGREFVLEDGITGSANAVLLTALKHELTTQVATLVTANTLNNPFTAGKPLAWDGVKKSWFVKNIDIPANPILNVPDGVDDLAVRIDDNGTTLHYSLRGKEIKDLGDIETEYSKALIKEQLLANSPALKPYIEKLPFDVNVIVPDGSYGFKAEVTLGGMTMDVVGTGPGASISNGIKVLDGTLGTPVDLKDIDIPLNSQGDELRAALTATMLHDPYLEGPILMLQSQMEHTSESLASHLGELGNERFWILPIDARGAINGKIIDQQWKYTLQFKLYETLEMFEESLKGKTGAPKKFSEIETSYQDYIEDTHTELNKLSTYIASLPDNTRANEFKDLLSGDGKGAAPGSTHHGVPTGLEKLNYDNKQYRTHFNDFKKMIQDPRYNYRGFETLDVSAFGANDEAYETYATLMKVWSHHTRRSARVPGTLDPKDERWMRFVVKNVKAHLENATSQGAISRSTLPKAESEEDIEKWMPFDQDEYERRLSAGKETDYVPPPLAEENPKGSIDPGALNARETTVEKRLPKLKPLLDKLETIGQETYFNRINGRLDTSDPHITQLLEMAQNMKMALTYRAIVENWNQETLEKQYKDAMERLYTISANRPWTKEIYGQLERFMDWILESEDLGETGTNKFIDGRRVGLRDKLRLTTELVGFEKKFLEGDNICIQRSADGVTCTNQKPMKEMDEDALEYVRNKLAPFYRTLILNQGIVQNEDAQTIKRNHLITITNLAKTCYKGTN